MSNQSSDTAVMTVRSTNATNTDGRVLPMINSRGRSGLTISCSSVPISRSRTTASEVSSSVMSSTMVPMTAGTL